MDLFAKAKKKTTKTAKKSDKLTVSVKDKNFFENIQEIEKLKKSIKSDEARIVTLSSTVKDIGKREWLDLYKKEGRNPGSIVIAQEKDGEVAESLYMVKDQYKKISEDGYDMLVEAYGDDIAESNTTYSFNKEMVEKYGSVISKLISECDEIAENDKKLIIEQTTTYSVKKGTLDKMDRFEDEDDEVVDVETLFEIVSPIVALSSEKVVKL